MIDNARPKFRPSSRPMRPPTNLPRRNNRSWSSAAERQVGACEDCVLGRLAKTFAILRSDRGKPSRYGPRLCGSLAFCMDFRIPRMCAVLVGRHVWNLSSGIASTKLTIANQKTRLSPQ
jgi:hypothetical protein